MTPNERLISALKKAMIILSETKGAIYGIRQSADFVDDEAHYKQFLFKHEGRLEDAVNECEQALSAPLEDGWIEVDIKEKATWPEVQKNVLLWTGLPYPDDHMIGCRHSEDPGPFGLFWDEEANYMSIPVTYWQSLPPPPSSITQKD